MFFNLINLVKGLLFFTGSYSNNVFLEPLTPEEEDKYVKLMLEGNTSARNKLIEHNLRLVAHIVKKYTNSNNDMTDDLISIGTIGLIKGIDTYKNNKKTKITTYAARCIQNEILMHFRANKKSNNDVYLEDSIGYDKEGNNVNLIDVLIQKDLDLIDYLTKKDNINELKKYLQMLTPREKEIIVKRYGLNNQKEMTQKGIAKELKISRSYVSRIEKRALTKILREFIKNNHYEELDKYYNLYLDGVVKLMSNYKILLNFEDITVEQNVDLLNFLQLKRIIGDDRTALELLKIDTIRRLGGNYER